jgi:hypothetical protein
VLARGGPQTRFNVEIKLDPRSPVQFAPLDEAVDAGVRVIADAGVRPHVSIQSVNWQGLPRVQPVRRRWRPRT